MFEPRKNSLFLDLSNEKLCCIYQSNSKAEFLYKCVFVTGEHPAAMQHGGQLRLEYPIVMCMLSVFVVLVGP